MLLYINLQQLDWSVFIFCTKISMYPHFNVISKLVQAVVNRTRLVTFVYCIPCVLNITELQPVWYKMILGLGCNGSVCHCTHLHYKLSENSDRLIESMVMRHCNLSLLSIEKKWTDMTMLPGASLEISDIRQEAERETTGVMNHLYKQSRKCTKKLFYFICVLPVLSVLPVFSVLPVLLVAISGNFMGKDGNNLKCGGPCFPPPPPYLWSDLRVLL